MTLLQSQAPLLAAPFCFLRHGETDYNRTGLIAGSTEVALNATGHAQARAAAQQLKSAGIDAIWSSPMKRAQETARYIADALGLGIAVVNELAERHWGVLEGRPRALRTRGVTPSGGESAEVFRDRTRAGFMRVLPSRLPLIVAHSGTYRVLSDWLDFPRQDTPVTNSQPLLLKPSTTGNAWIVEPL